MLTPLRVLDKGHVALVRTMPLPEADITLDQAIVQAARASTTQTILDQQVPHITRSQGLKTEQQDRKLLRYLWEHGHHSPFEMVELQWHIKAPLFVRSQWMRHRTWSYNEMSGRYQEIPEEYYVPLEWRGQSSANKQASNGELSVLGQEEATDWYRTAVEYSLKQYRDLIELGVAREMARMVLPQSMYTEFYAKVDLRNCLHFLKLRDHEGAQWEIVQYARAMKQLLRQVAPWVMELAFPTEGRSASGGPEESTT